jgi:2-hydroxychromene-2-carboxylate isomerase
VDGSAAPVFFYDLGSPRCYLVAERIVSAFDVVPEWEPVHAPQLGEGDPEPTWASIEQLAAEHALQQLRWPHPWPPDTRMAMLGATYAKKVGRVVGFSLAAFRQTFAGGRDLGDENTVLIAGAACEMHPAALLKGVALRSTETALALAGERALAAGVRSLPAITVGEHVFEGDQAIERAADALAAACVRVQA